jgi:hypothetical protein
MTEKNDHSLSLTKNSSGQTDDKIQRPYNDHVKKEEIPCQKRFASALQHIYIIVEH